MLTIVSVSYHSAEYLKLNRELTGYKYPWLVYQNDDIEELNDYSMGHGPERFDVFNGTNDPTINAGNIGYASFNHAKGLNHLVRQVNTKYVLVLDPDFFIAPPLEEILKRMEGRDLAFFGAPYPISDKERIQDFPVAFCMFINLEKVPANELDFTPSSVDGWASDTGYQVYKKYKGNASAEIALPNYAGGATKFQHTKLSLSKLYGIKTNFDEYFWREKLFGVHAHMKMHLRNEDERKARLTQQLKDIKTIMKRAKA